MWKPEAKHWQMQRDGDVWYAIWRAILATGPDAVNVAKVKGHATLKGIDDQRATAAHKAGNDVADRLVSEATPCHDKGTVDLAYWLEARQKTDCQVMAEVQRFIIRMLSLDKRRKGSKSHGNDPLRASLGPEDWPYPSSSPAALKLFNGDLI